MNTLMRRSAAVLLAAGTVLVATGQAAQSAPSPKPAKVTGTAEFTLPFFPDDDVRRFSFDVRSTPYTRPLPGLPTGSPADATGTVRVSHRLADTGATVRFEAAADCLITSPGYATVTAVVTRADDVVKDWVGKRIGLSVQDAGHGPDRVGFSWSLSADQNEAGEWGAARIGTCLAPAPFGPVTRGDLHVRHADLTPLPAGR
jgi:hypothetical protein